MPFAKIWVVDEHDQPVGMFPKEEVWQKGLFHRIVLVLAQDDAGRLLLQKRSPHVDLFPGVWDYSAAGHVDEGESYETAAQRETAEEIGVAEVWLVEKAGWQSHDMLKGRMFNRFNKLYTAHIQNPGTLQKSEVTEIKWFDVKDLRQQVADYPDRFSPGLIATITKYY